MHLIELMDGVPLWLVGLIVMIVAQTYAIGLMLLTRSIFGVSRLAENNEVAGFKFAVVGVFYAVLLAFVVVAVWEEYRNTEAAVRNEAKAAVDLHHVSFGLPLGDGAVIRQRSSPTQTTSGNLSGLPWPAARLATTGQGPRTAQLGDLSSPAEKSRGSRTLSERAEIADGD